ncbi:MAG TPA: presqualene diphosphate synthase HpnD [Pseudonocardia sp.]|nr:presqualene diphosphate synthase HpnD [Pseudonocardia sp.]
MTGTAGPGDLDAAYAECERITRTEARNFSYGIRLLPPPKRRALSAVYAFARRVDDIGDGDLPAAVKLERLEQARRDVHSVQSVHSVRPVGRDSPDPVLVALADAGARMPIPMGAFDELVDGCEADVRGTRYPTFDALVHYCRCVAGSVGRLSLGVFGLDGDSRGDPAEQAAASREADALGVALQLTNILRDVREDHGNGRVYLPEEDLGRFGVALGPDAGPDGVDPHAYAALVRFEAERAERWYTEGLRLLPRLDRRSRACCAAMAGIYHRLLHRIAADPAAALRGRMSLPGWQKAVVAGRSLAGLAP